MKDLTGKVAVVTGAASGIGWAMAERFVAEGMRVVLADVETEALALAERRLTDRGATVLVVRTNVSRAEEVDRLAARTLDAFGAVHVVCNNAGVGLFKATWEHTLADWEWILGVNLWGVINGVRAFVPILLRQDVEAHVVNTASVAGLETTGFIGSYCVSKHGVVALSEALAQELAAIGVPVKVSVLCPHVVHTNIMSSQRNRSSRLGDPADVARSASAVESPPVMAARRVEGRLRDGIDHDGMPPSEVADHVVRAIRDERFYVLTHPDRTDDIRARVEAILRDAEAGRAP